MHSGEASSCKRYCVFLSSETEEFKPKADTRSGSRLFSISIASAHRTVPYFQCPKFWSYYGTTDKRCFKFLEFLRNPGKDMRVLFLRN